jgi:penicillin-binding protein 1A
MIEAMSSEDDFRRSRRDSTERSRTRGASGRDAARRPPRTEPRDARSQAASGRRATGRPDQRSRRPAKRKSGWRTFLKIAGLIVLLGFIAGSVTGCVMYNNIAAGLPDPTKPLTGTDQTTQVLDRNGKAITELFAEQNRQHVALKDIPPSVRQAVIATEDQRFYEHPGVDLLGLARAIVTDIRAGAKVQGGSTITQQYVKQAFVGDESSVRRKVSEAILAYRVEQSYTKDQILEMYLNTIYFGHGSYGIQTAAKTYFGKPVGSLGVAEAAVLAGVIKSPRSYSPYLDPTAAKQRRDTVLAQMRDQGYIDASTFASATASPIKTAGLKHGSTIAPYFVEYIKDALVRTYGEDKVYRGGLRVKTTLDLGKQAAAEAAVRSAFKKASDPSAAVVGMDPKTGQILAMVGGRDFQSQQYNVAVQGHRQTGSAFKPFVLATALKTGVSPEQTFASGSMKLKIPGGQTWSVTGAHGGGGPMRLRPATWESVNSVFAQLILKVGADTVVATAKSMGIATKITPVPAVALGGMAEGVTPLEMADAFGTLANGGTTMKPYAILEVKDSNGAVLYSGKPAGIRSLTPAVAYLTTDILKGVITNGTGTAADIGRPAAGKTGTTQEYRDAWFVGYTPDLVASVWVGYPESQREMTNVHGIKVTGGSFPAQIWASFMKSALASTPKTPFTQPTGLTSARICLDSGGKAGPYCPRTGSGLFLTEFPPGDCPLHLKPAAGMPNLVGQTKASAIATLGKLSLKYTIVEKKVDGFAAGIVAKQDPAAGSVITSGTVVSLTVSTGGAPAAKPPVAAFEFSPKKPAPATAVAFDAGASSAEGTIVKWVWDFGEGAKDSTSGKNATHTYPTAGTFNVTLTVTDDKGATASVSKTITVK